MDGGEREPRRVYTPGDVAERLGISGQRLRQLARSYEHVRGELPRDERGRVWPEEAVEDLVRARELVRRGRAGGIEQALRGELVPEGTEAPPANRNPSAGDIAAVADELRAMREAIEAQNRIMEAMAKRLEDLERENRRIREVVEPLPSRELGSPDQAGENQEPFSVSEDDGAEPPPGDLDSRRTPEPERSPWRLVRRFLGL